MTGDDHSSIRFVDLAAQYRAIRTEVDEAMRDVVERADFILGEEVERFEDEFAAFCGVAHAVGVDSGTSALELSLRAVGVGAGDEVITVANTFIATAAAISHTGAMPILVDMDPATYQIAVDQLEAAIGPRTAAIVAVHLYGHPADMDGVCRIARRHGLVVTEDASQAHGARYRGARVGSLGDVAAFSLYPGKNLGAYGDAGIVATHDPDRAHRVRLGRNHGSSKKYLHESIGYNRRLDTLQAAVLRVKLRHLDGWNSARRRHAGAYDARLDEIDAVRVPPTSPDVEPVYHLYAIRVPDRDRLQTRLDSEGVATIIHYPIPIHLQQAYSSLPYSRGSFPEAEIHANEVLSLPMFPELTDRQIDRVCEIIADHYR